MALQNAGWCTPTIVTITVGLLVVIALVIALIINPKRSMTNSILISLIATLFWTIVLTLILFYLCANGKGEASWWVFSLVYLLPLAIGIILAFITAIKNN